MKKDIHISEVKDVYIAVVLEYNKAYKVFDWNAYIINNKSVCLDKVIIVTKGSSRNKITTTFRKKIDALPAKSFAKIEMIQEELFVLNNSFKISFFEKNVMCDKTFIFPKNTITKDVFQELPVMNERGILAE